MEDINQDGNSEIAGNKAIIGSGISQIEAIEKKKKKKKKQKKKNKNLIFIVKVTLKFLFYLFVNNHHLIKHKAR